MPDEGGGRCRGRHSWAGQHGLILLLRDILRPVSLAKPRGRQSSHRPTGEVGARLSRSCLCVRNDLGLSLHPPTLRGPYRPSTMEGCGVPRPQVTLTCLDPRWAGTEAPPPRGQQSASNCGSPWTHRARVLRQGPQGHGAAGVSRHSQFLSRAR